jgi:hypothetical protein
MFRRAPVVLVLLASVSVARADDAEKMAMARVRLTTDNTRTTGCTRLGWVRDDSLKDLRRKIVRAGGDTGVLSFRSDDLSAMDAEVFRCPPSKNAAPSVPPPPPGPPPPPPPGPSR